MMFSTEEAAQGVTVVRMAGDLTVVTAQDVRAWFKETVANGSQLLVVDLARIQHIDSSGLSAMVSALRTARTDGGDLRISRPSQPVLDLLEITTLNRVVRPYSTIEDAVASFAIPPVPVSLRLVHSTGSEHARELATGDTGIP